MGLDHKGYLRQRKEFGFHSPHSGKPLESFPIKYRTDEI